MDRILVVGDIHGNHKGLLQCLERSGFNNKTDTLISLGDVVDGHCDSYEVVEELLKIKKLIAIKGNHDDWFYTWLRTGINPSNWGQGQAMTGASYLKHLGIEDYNNKYHLIHTLIPQDVPKNHHNFFINQKPYYIDDKNRLFIHGGFNRHYSLEDQDEHNFWWDRDLWSQALSYRDMTNGPLNEKPRFKMKGDFSEVFIGHTSTQFWRENEPMHAANIWNLDTGGGWFGKVSIMDVDTKEFWQSDNATELYPEFRGR